MKKKKKKKAHPCNHKRTRTQNLKYSEDGFVVHGNTIHDELLSDDEDRAAILNSSADFADNSIDLGSQDEEPTTTITVSEPTSQPPMFPQTRLTQWFAPTHDTRTFETPIIVEVEEEDEDDFILDQPPTNESAVSPWEASFSMIMTQPPDAKLTDEAPTPLEPCKLEHLFRLGRARR